MRIFADTSGIYALLVSNDRMHKKAAKQFDLFSEADAQLITSSFVLVETAALLQRRVGIESLHDFQTKVFPLFDVVWADLEWYNKAFQRLIILGDKKVSLVDCLSFEIMEALEIQTAFSFDTHFEDMGFSLTPQL